MWEGVNLAWFAGVSVNLIETSQCVSSIDVHCAGSANTCINKNKTALNIISEAEKSEHNKIAFLSQYWTRGVYYCSVIPEK